MKLNNCGVRIIGILWVYAWVSSARKYFGQELLRATRFRMRRAEDPPSPLDHVLHDGLGFEHVVACVEISPLASTDWC